MLSAAAIKCIGGQLLGKLWPRDEDERQAAIDAGYDLDEMLDVERLVSGNDVFFAATGVTDGELLQGVRYSARQGDHRVAGDALALGHGANRHGPPRPGEAARGDRGPLRLSADRGRLVAGATGYIGGLLARALREDGVAGALPGPRSRPGRGPGAARLRDRPRRRAQARDARAGPGGRRASPTTWCIRWAAARDSDFAERDQRGRDQLRRGGGRDAGSAG